MNKQELCQAFSNIHASDALKAQVLSAEMENRKTENYRKLVRRVVACAAVMALLIAVCLFGKAPSYFSVQVYANETDYVELNQRGTTVFVPAPDDSYDFSYRDDPSYRPTLDSYIGEAGGKLGDETWLWLRLWLDDETMDYDQIVIFLDGKQLEQSFTDGFLGYISKEDEEGRFIALPVEKTTLVNIVLYDVDGNVLQEYGMKVEPVDGGWNVTLDRTYITSLGSAVFQKFS